MRIAGQEDEAYKRLKQGGFLAGVYVTEQLEDDTVHVVNDPESSVEKLIVPVLKVRDS